LLTNTDFTGKFLLHLQRVDSTNNYAKDYMAKTNPKDGSVILADEQYAGRGQAGAAWEAEPLQNLTFSIIYHTDFLPAASQFYLNMAISLGLCRAVEDSLHSAEPASREVCIKWPNDIYVKNNKIAGILIENIIQGTHLSKSIIGIGLNVNQASFPGSMPATSLKLETGTSHERLEILKRVLEHVERHFRMLKTGGNTENLQKNYLGHLYRFGEWHTYADSRGQFRGCIRGVNNYGKLQVETESGIREFGMKEIEYR
jgi:BirA family transcriptional regulator, biotin operon repressor / biotin---[acetyl-CoA-carboxylase] ligase